MKLEVVEACPSDDKTERGLITYEDDVYQNRDVFFSFHLQFFSFRHPKRL
jgi:hypothetical protein